MKTHYTDEKTTQIVIALLKKHGVRRVIASPGATNVTLVASMQSDPYFEMYSSVDERSAAYMACGLAAETGEPVVISCTGATASRNYLPGLTEAFYRKLPVLAITSTQPVNRVGHHIAQVTDRSSIQNDVVKLSVALPFVKDDDDLWECEIKINQAILELSRHGGGPAHINLPTIYSPSYDTRELPGVRVINRIALTDKFPELPRGRVAIFVGSHTAMSEKETAVVDAFCASNDAVVFCDHTSGYKGKFRVLYSLVAGQRYLDVSGQCPDVCIHIGEITGDYFSHRMVGQQVWRVNPDGEIRDTFRKLRYVFEMPEHSFFEYYTKQDSTIHEGYLKECKDKQQELHDKIPDLPFSNIWIASKMAHRIPEGAVLHLGILNSLRSWNFFELPASVHAFSNVGGFGIDGGISSLLGASLTVKDKLYFGIMGDLATFYDLNALGNRHLSNNLRILLVNNGKGTEFKNYDNHAARFGDEADMYMAAAGHFGNKSRILLKNFTEALGFEYLSASNKQEFDVVYERFLTEEITDRPMFFEVFTNSSEESDALEKLLGIAKDGVTFMKSKAQKLAMHTIGASGIKVLKKVLGK